MRRCQMICKWLHLPLHARVQPALEIGIIVRAYSWHLFGIVLVIAVVSLRVASLANILQRVANRQRNLHSVSGDAQDCAVRQTRTFPRRFTSSV